MTFIGQRIRSFVRDETAQGTLEYIFAIMIVLSIVVLAIRDFLRPLLEKIGGYVDQRLGDSLFKNFHQYKK